MKPMDSRSIDSELLDRMTEVELHLKYQCFSPALELLRGIIESHPDYLPAKEALRELYRRRGDSAKAQEIDREIALLRERLADKSLQHDSGPALPSSQRRGSSPRRSRQSSKRSMRRTNWWESRPLPPRDWWKACTPIAV